MMAEALSKLLAGEGMGMPGITTSVIPQDGIFLEENTSGRRTRIGVYAPPELERGHEVSCQPFAAEGDAALFGSAYEDELCMLPEGKGGSWLIKKYPQNVRGIEALSQWELQDIDTPEDLQACSTWIKSAGISCCG